MAKKFGIVDETNPAFDHIPTGYDGQVVFEVIDNGEGRGPSIVHTSIKNARLMKNKSNAELAKSGHNKYRAILDALPGE